MTRFITFIIRAFLPIFIGACTTHAPQALPTLARLPTLTAAPVISPTPTSTPTASPSFTPSPTITDTPTVTPTPSGAPLVMTASGTQTPPTAPPAIAPAISPTPLPSAFSFGKSADGRDLLAYSYGAGERLLLLIGGIHAGFEANTIQLVEALRAHYERVPADVQAGVQLVLIPSLNPDGAAYGRQLRGRFNGNEVDLNRNWACDWSAQAYFGELPVQAGAAPFSEPESQALAALILEIEPDAVIFYHGASNGVFDGRCGGLNSVELARVYGEVSNYPYGDAFGDYRVTGSAPAWVNSLGIPAIDVELATTTGTEFMRNLRAVNAVQAWLLGAQNP